MSWIGNVPVHWESWKLSHAFESIGSGTTPPSTEPQWYEGGNTPWVTTGELRENIVTETAKGVTDAALKQFTALRVHPAGSLVIAMYGATIGRLGVLGVDAATNQACCVLSKPKALTIAFAYYWLQGFKQIIIDLFSTGGGQPNISQDVVSSLRVPAPEIQEQKQITEFLDRETAKIDALVAEQEQLITLLKEKRQAVISHAVTKGLDPSVPMKDSGVEWLGEVPAHWDLSKVKHVCYVNDGNHGEEYPKEGDYTDELDGVPFIRGGNIVGLSVSSEDMLYITREKNDSMRKGNIRAGDILFMNRGDIGKVALVPPEFEGANLNSQIAYLRCNTNLQQRFLLHFLVSKQIQCLIESMKAGSVLTQFPIRDINEIAVPLPDLSEQNAIVKLLDDTTSRFDELTIEAERTIELLQERRSALISAAVTGQIDIRGGNDGVKS